MEGKLNTMIIMMMSDNSSDHLQDSAAPAKSVLLTAHPTDHYSDPFAGRRDQCGRPRVLQPIPVVVLYSSAPEEDSLARSECSKNTFANERTTLTEMDFGNDLASA